MNCWCLKIAEQTQYSDQFGKTYVYDNRHSTRVAEGDKFVYLEKVGHSKLRFRGVGSIARVDSRSANPEETMGGKVRLVYTAVLTDFHQFATPIDISANKQGLKNRGALGLANLNEDGLSRSVARISPTLYQRINELSGISGRLPEPGVPGVTYRPPSEDVSLDRPEPFEVDPSIVERGLLAHRRTQNVLADHLRSFGILPRSPGADDPDFDIGWEFRGRFFVGEVKSISDRNEEKQLRLGIGQVLRYAYQLCERLATVPVLVAERCPKDAGWHQLCDRLGVLLLWPEIFHQLQTILTTVASPDKAQ